MPLMTPLSASMLPLTVTVRLAASVVLPLSVRLFVPVKTKSAPKV